ncbi:MAG: hypothetical protein GX885_05825 [Methanomicrobiales archaeon]|nr:hypothetical protein [Methanomicrobiales archaeon]
MDAFERIPVDVRWKLAAQGLSALPFTYRRAIRDGADDQLYNEVERDIWRELGRDVGVIARAFRMPLGDAHEVAEAFAVATKVLLGPEWRYEIRNSAPDEADLMVRRCALVDRAREMEEDPLAACNVCHAFANAAIPDLNPDYAPEYRSGICAGDNACSIIIKPVKRK